MKLIFLIKYIFFSCAVFMVVIDVLFMIFRLKGHIFHLVDKEFLLLASLKLLIIYDPFRKDK